MTDEAEFSQMTGKHDDVWHAHLQVGGTWAWAAPEILLGKQSTTQADIYSLGVVIWELVTGEQPVRGNARDVIVPAECPAVSSLSAFSWDNLPKAFKVSYDLGPRLGPYLLQQDSMHLQLRGRWHVSLGLIQLTGG